jgi:hypothetical protein
MPASQEAKIGKMVFEASQDKKVSEIPNSISKPDVGGMHL